MTLGKHTFGRSSHFPFPSIAGMVVAALLLVVVSGCEDPVPTDYVPAYVFTGYLYVDEPVTGVTLTRSVAPLDTFRVENSIVSDADITIWSVSDTIHLEYVPDSSAGTYRAVDTTKRISPSTRYEMRAELTDGSVLTAATETPERIEWTQPPREVIQYPVDTVNLPSPDSLKLKWTAAQGIREYLIEVKCLDTLGYGKYLEPPTQEKNRRIYRFFEEDFPRYDETVRWGFLQNTEVNVVWFAFKWFGRHQISVYAADAAMIEWFKQIRFSGNQYQSTLSNVNGGLGVFGSASVVKQESILLKNQK